MDSHDDREGSPNDSLGAILKTIVETARAVAGVVWVMDESGRVMPVRSFGLSSTGITDSKEIQGAHERLVQTVCTAGGVQVIPPRARLPWNVGEDTPANPTDLAMILVPVENAGRRHGLIEVLERRGGEAVGATTQRAAQLIVIAECAAMVAVLLEHQQRVDGLKADAVKVTPEKLAGLISRVHESLDPVATTFLIANESRRMIGCDRVNVLVRRRGRFRLEAVSEEEAVRPEDPRVHALESLGSAVAHERRPLWNPDASNDVPPAIRGAAEDYRRESSFAAFAAIPLDPPRGRGPDPVGVLVAEWNSTVPWDDEIRNRVEIMAAHGGIALANALDHSTVPQRVMRALLNQFPFTRLPWSGRHVRFPSRH